MPISLQALLPSFRSLADRLIDQSKTTTLCDNIDAPLLITSNDGAVQTVIDTNDPTKPYYKKIVNVEFVNCGISAVKFAINTNASSEVFHGIVVGSVVQDDGSGGNVRLLGFRGKLTVFSSAAYRLATFVSYE